MHVMTGMRVLDNEYKLRQNIKIAMLYLEDDDAVSAEMFIKKAATLIASCKVTFTRNPALPCLLLMSSQLSYHVCIGITRYLWAGLHIY